MNLILLGPPGAGKGTCARMLADKKNFFHISTGDILREEVKKGTSLGQNVRNYMESGKLVADEVILDIIEQRLENWSGGDKSFVLDGFPRTMAQAEGLESVLQKKHLFINQVILLDVPEGELIRRLSSRRVCGNCGANYNLISQPPKIPDVCDYCGGKLYQREDDREETVRNRLRIYQQEIQPLVDHYTNKGLLVRLDGEGTIDDVFQRLLTLLQLLKKDDYS